MNITEIKTAVDNGKLVNWNNPAYRVIKDSIGQYLIHCTLNDNYIGLHGLAGTEYENRLNGEEQDFYVGEI